MIKYIKKLICHFKGHYYGVSYYQEWQQVKVKNRKSVRSHVKSTFTCERCGFKAKKLNQKQSKKILDSDQFGYR